MNTDHSLAVAICGWLIDFALLSTLLLAAALVVIRYLRQPLGRLVVARATLISLSLLAVLVALPTWPRVAVWTPAKPTVDGRDKPVSMTPSFGAPGAGAQGNELIPQETPAKTQRSLEPAEARAPLADGQRPVVKPVDTATHENSAGQSSGVGQLARLLDSVSSWVAPIVAVAYLLGSCAAVCWLVFGAYCVRGILRRSTVATADLVREFHRLTGRTTELKLLTTDSIRTAIAVGALRPTIVLPASVAEKMPEARAAMAHEWAHVCRGDLWTLAIGRLLMVVLYAQPLFWLLRHKMRDDQEMLADAFAASALGRNTYADQLLDWARRHVAAPRPGTSAAIGLWDQPSRLTHRVQYLLDDERSTQLTAPRLMRVCVTTCVALVAVTLSTLTLSAHRIERPLLGPGSAVDALAKGGAGTADAAIETTAVDDPSAPLRPDDTTPLDIMGRVASTVGTPVADALVMLLDLSHDRVIATTTSDVEGEYVFESPYLEFIGPEHLDYVDIAIVARSDAHGLAWQRGYRVNRSVTGTFGVTTTSEPSSTPLIASVANDGRSADQSQVKNPQILINATFSSRRSLSGRVVDADGKAVAGAAIRLMALGGPPADAKSDVPVPLEPATLRHSALGTNLVEPVVTDADGRWQLDGLPPDVWVELSIADADVGVFSTFMATSAVAAAYPDFDAPLPTGDHTIALPATQPVVLKVRNALDGTAVAGINVEIKQQVGPHEVVHLVGATDRDGHIDVRLPVGQYDVRLSPPAEFNAELPFRADEQQLTVVDQSTAQESVTQETGAQEIGLDMTPGSVVELRVVDDATGAPLPNVRVRSRDMAHEWVVMLGEFVHMTDAEGMIRKVVVPAVMRFYVAEDDVAMVHGYRVVEAPPEPVDLAPGGTYRHTFRLKEIGAPFIPVPDDDLNLASREHQQAVAALREHGVAVTTRYVPIGDRSSFMTHAVVTPLWKGHAEGLENLQRLEGLTALLFVESGVAPADRSPPLPVVHDDALATLRNLELQSLLVQRSDVTERGLAVLPTIRGLIQLTLASTALTDDGLAQLEPLQTLRQLKITLPRISEVGLGHLAKLEQLVILSITTDEPLGPGIDQLQSSRVTQLTLHADDDSLVHVAKLTGLTHLLIERSELTDDGIAHLAGSNVADLTVYGPSFAVTDASIEHFAAMPRLKQLKLMGTSVTDEGVARMAQLRPDVVVRVKADYKPLSASGSGAPLQ